jgi:drug/metabolite transporter (DMT)-like permease
MAAFDVVLLVALSAIWGSSFVFMRVLAPLIGPVATADLRMLVAGIVLVAGFLAARFRAGWREHWSRFLAIGLLNSAVPFLLFSVAALVLPPSMEAIFNAMAPMFAAVLAAIWLGEPLTARKGAGLVLGVAGVVLMSSLGGLPAGTRTVLAVGACLLAPLCYAFAGVYIRKRASGIRPLAIAGGSQILGGAALLPFLIAAPPPLAALTPRLALLVAAFALLCSAAAYLIYYRLIADVGPTKALTVTFLIPAFAMLWQLLILGEPVTGFMLAGAAAVLAGTFLVAAGRPSGRDTGRRVSLGRLIAAGRSRRRAS